MVIRAGLQPSALGINMTLYKPTANHPTSIENKIIMQDATATETGRLRVVFIGTPDFAAISLQALLTDGPALGIDVVGVVTATDKPGKRGSDLVPSAVKEVALAHNLPILQPEKLRNPDFLEDLAALKADLQVIVAFRMLPEIVWDMPPMGSLNVHGSLLPNYRGAAPINWALINGETKTGVTTFLLRHEIDTGDLLMQQEVDILPEDDFGSLYQRMAIAGSELLVQTLSGLLAGTITPIPQGELPTAIEGEPDRSRAPKLKAETGLIDFSWPSIRIQNLVRGLSPVPAAYFLWAGEKVKLYQTTVLSQHEVIEAHGAALNPGQILVLKDQLLIGTADGAIAPISMQFPGKKRLTVAEVIRGLRSVPEFVG